MTHLVKVLDDPIIIGLTGTPPEGKSSSQETRYLSLVGEIDYQVPTPALVKEGGLAPYQDLAYFTEPTEKELMFLEEQHDEFHVLIEELTTPIIVYEDEQSPAGDASGGEVSVSPLGGVSAAGASNKRATIHHTPLSIWVRDRVFSAVQKDVVRFGRVNAASTIGVSGKTPPRATNSKAQLPTTAKEKSKSKSSAKKLPPLEEIAGKKIDNGLPPGMKKPFICPGGWTELMQSQADLAQALCRYLWKAQIPLPRNIDLSEALLQSPVVDDWMRVLDDYAAHKLKSQCGP